MTKEYALITFKNGDNMLCLVSGGEKQLYYDPLELVKRGISDEKFRKEMNRAGYYTKMGTRYKSVTCPICNGDIERGLYRDEVCYCKCQNCGRTLGDIRAVFAKQLRGGMNTVSSISEIWIDDATFSNYSTEQELKDAISNRLRNIPHIILNNKIYTFVDTIKQKAEDEYLDCDSPARILKKALKEMETTDQMLRNSIIEIKEIVPNKVYEYKFANGDIQKTVCSDSDQFSMEDSITIAYAKHFMGGSGVYNRAVDKAMKLFVNQKSAEEKAKKEAEAAKTRQEKKAKKRAERLARKREAELEEKIAIQAEAYRRAMQSMAEKRPNKKFEKHKKPKEA